MNLILNFYGFNDKITYTNKLIDEM